VQIKLKFSQAFVEQFSYFLRYLKKEIVKIVLLGSKLQLIKELTILEGSLNTSIVHPKKIMTLAIRESATLFALIHNHPSGDPTPS
jgi:DNA repair protein RadC